MYFWRIYHTHTDSNIEAFLEPAHVKNFEELLIGCIKWTTDQHDDNVTMLKMMLLLLMLCVLC